MIEGFAREMPEDRMLEALEEAHRVIITICEMQDELVAKGGKPKKECELPARSSKNRMKLPIMLTFEGGRNHRQA